MTYQSGDTNLYWSLPDTLGHRVRLPRLHDVGDNNVKKLGRQSPSTGKTLQSGASHDSYGEHSLSIDKPRKNMERTRISSAISGGQSGFRRRQLFDCPLDRSGKRYHLSERLFPVRNLEIPVGVRNLGTFKGGSASRPQGMPQSSAGRRNVNQANAASVMERIGSPLNMTRTERWLTFTRLYL